MIMGHKLKGMRSAFCSGLDEFAWAELWELDSIRWLQCSALHGYCPDFVLGRIVLKTMATVQILCFAELF
jgi:hypothetical protein